MVTARRVPKILIVDDETLNVRLLEMTLNDEYETITANNGIQAIKLIQECHPDLVLLDVMMPGMNGFEVCRSIKSDSACASLPIIFVTALEKISDESQGLTLGAVDYITKPINPDIVKLRVKNHLELKFQRDQLKEQRDLLMEQRDVLERQKIELEETLKRVKRLEGILSICMYCKKIRTEDKSWEQMEKYISDHTDALFSHGVCPDCFGEFQKSMKR
jgi:response regulator RpfG family c-di-GMP phosphodiesterase